jgi:hypothetical protein
MSNPIKMTLAELLECNPLDVAKWAIREGDKLCAWQESTEKDQISVFYKRERAQREAQFRANKYKTKILLYELSFYVNGGHIFGRRRDIPLWLPVMSYCSESDE